MKHKHEDKTETDQKIPEYEKIIHKSRVDENIVYQEMYQEMRRHRDYELTASTWYTTFLIIILGLIFDFKTDGITITKLDSWIQRVIFSIDFVSLKILILILVSVLTTSSIFSICYAHKRYIKIREFVNDTLEPNWSKVYFDEEKCKNFTPRDAIIITQLVLALIIIKLLIFL